MKKNVLFTIICIICICSYAQSRKTIGRTTVYEEFQPAIIEMHNGKIINEKHANIFLKNSALLYKHGTVTKQADMNMIKSVAFKNRKYYCLDTLLVYLVDSVDNNKLFCTTKIDLEAYRNQLLNNRQITNLEIRTQVNVSFMTLSEIDDSKYPLINYFFYEIDGKIIKVHERTILSFIPKERRRIFKTITQQPDFSWSDKNCLLRLLKAIS